MTAATVFIINGRPRAGKDTLQDMLSRVYISKGYLPLAFSSIDPIRHALTNMGLDLSAKTPEDRSLLATMGAALETHSRFRSRACVSFVERARDSVILPVVIFLMIREPEIIERVRRDLLDQGQKVYRILVESIHAEVPTNTVDADAETMAYDFRVQNHGTLLDLAQEAHALVDLVQMRKEVRYAGE